MKNILFIYTPHLRLNLICKIQLDIMLRHLDRGDRVYFMTCSSSSCLSNCTYNPEMKKNLCYLCRSAQKQLISMLQAHGSVIVLEYLESKMSGRLPVFDSVADLKKYTYKSVNIGIGVASRMISYVRDHEFCTLKYTKKIRNEIIKSAKVIDTLYNYIAEYNTDYVYVFNGRQSEYSAVVSFCKKFSIPFSVFEFTSRSNYYHLVPNTIPHDISYEYNQINHLWNSDVHSSSEKNDIGRLFFSNARKGISEIYDSHIKLQESDRLPLFCENKELIVIFNSSIDEYAAVPGWENNIFLFDSEVEAIKLICRQFLDDTSKLFVLRIHPNLKYMSNTQTRSLLELRGISNLYIIESTSSISSYALLDIASKIITFGSTIGVEATFAAKPSIVLGLCFWYKLDIAYVPQTREELFGLIANKQLKPKNQQKALMYGYWWQNFGERFSNVNICNADLQITTKDKLYMFFLKILSINEYSRLLRIFKGITYRKLCDEQIRNNILIELFPWKKK